MVTNIVLLVLLMPLALVWLLGGSVLLVCIVGAAGSLIYEWRVERRQRLFIDSGLKLYRSTYVR